VNIVVKLLAESLVVVLLMAFGWSGMTTLGSHSLQAMRYPIYVAGCPLADTLEQRSAGGSCSKEGVSHPMTSRQPGGGIGEHAHGAERHREGKAPPRTSQNSPSTHLGEYKGIEGRRVFAIPYVSRDFVCYESAASG
jgi:hypothetical protein